MISRALTRVASKQFGKRGYSSSTITSSMIAHHQLKRTVPSSLSLTNTSIPDNHRLLLKKQNNSLGTINQLLQKHAFSSQGGGGSTPWVHPDNQVPGEALAKYSVDLTNMAKEGKLDPVIGRHEEIRRTLQILARRTKNNPVLIGEPGVG